MKLFAIIFSFCLLATTFGAANKYVVDWIPTTPSISGATASGTGTSTGTGTTGTTSGTGTTGGSTSTPAQVIADLTALLKNLQTQNVFAILTDMMKNMPNLNDAITGLTSSLSGTALTDAQKTAITQLQIQLQALQKLQSLFPDMEKVLSQLQTLLPTLDLTKLQDSVKALLAKFNVSTQIQNAISRLIAIPTGALTFVAQVLENKVAGLTDIAKLALGMGNTAVQAASGIGQIGGNLASNIGKEALDGGSAMATVGLNAANDIAQGAMGITQAVGKVFFPLNGILTGVAKTGSTISAGATKAAIGVVDSANTLGNKALDNLNTAVQNLLKSLSNFSNNVNTSGRDGISSLSAQMITNIDAFFKSIMAAFPPSSSSASGSASGSTTRTTTGGSPAVVAPAA